METAPGWTGTRRTPPTPPLPNTSTATASPPGPTPYGDWTDMPSSDSNTTSCSPRTPPEGINWLRPPSTLFQVRANRDTATGTPSDAAPGATPGAPQNFSASGRSKSVDLSWSGTRNPFFIDKWQYRYAASTNNIASSNWST